MSVCGEYEKTTESKMSSAFAGGLHLTFWAAIEYTVQTPYDGAKPLIENIADERTVAVMTKEEKLNKIVEILHEDCKTPLEEIAVAIDAENMAEVGEMIDELMAKKVILGYGAIVDWDKLENYDKVVAYIEIKVTPQRYKGFDRIAERIYRYDEVKELNLISGAYDFGVTVEGRSIKDISLFVSDHLGPMESIIGTATHFVLKRYKKDGIILCEPPKDEREVISI